MSIEAIKATILESAEAKARDTVAAAEKARDEKLAAVTARLEADKRSLAEYLEKESAAVLQRRLTLARLESRMAALGVRQKLISKAYERAMQEFCSLPSDKYREFFARLVSDAAETGDVVCVGNEDKKTLNAEWLSSVSSRSGIKLAFGQNFDGRGVVLSGNGADKDLTLPTLIEQAREKTEGAVAEMLF